MKVEVNIPLYVTDIDKLDMHQQFLIAASRGIAGKIKQLINHPELDHNCFDSNGYTALHLAACRGNTEILNLLLESPKIKPNELDKLGRHAIELAWKRGCRKAVEALYRGIRARYSEVPAEASAWFFSQMLFSNRDDIFGQLQNIQKTCERVTNPHQKLTTDDSRDLNCESTYWLNKHKNNNETQV